MSLSGDTGNDDDDDDDNDNDNDGNPNKNLGKLFCRDWLTDSNVYTGRPKIQNCQHNIEGEQKLEDWHYSISRLLVKLQ